MKASVLPIVEFRGVHRSDLLALSGYLSMAAMRYQAHSRNPHRRRRKALLKLPSPALINHQNLASTRFTIGYY
jgi:hypothetical protein